METTFKRLLEGDDFVFLDGAMGTMIQKSGAKYNHVPEELNISNPELLTSIAKVYSDAGAQIVYANTFGANAYKLEDTGLDVRTVVTAAVANARKGVAGTDTLVALDIGPIGQLLEPAGALAFEDAYNYFKEMVLAGKDADVAVIETMTDLYEAKAALLAVKENSDLPVLVTLTYEESGRTFAGVSAEAAALTLSGLGADAIGVNCSLGPDQLGGVVAQLAAATDKPLVVKPNAGLPDPNSGDYSIGPETFAEDLEKLIPLGARILGGCCGTTPDYIRAIRKHFAGKKPVERKKPQGTAVCSPSTVVHIDGPRIIGERINPTGKKVFQQALRDNDMDYILKQALSQVEAGAEILDVNVGLPGIDERQRMVAVIQAIQGVCDAPLQIDSTKPDVLEAALRAYNGRPIVNSVNGEEKSLSTVLPLVKKYGAAVIGLTLDEDGIPKTAEKRFEIAKRIVERAEAIGIAREDVYIDCLTLTVSSEQAACRATLDAVKRVTQELGCRTALGVSNISFGLPNRPQVNSTFLTMAMENGLTLPIINPNLENMTGAVRAFRVLNGIDQNALAYIDAYKDYVPVKQQAASSGKKSPSSGGRGASSTGDPVFDAVCRGLQTEGANAVREALETEDPMDIVNNKLIPALDKVGDDFESHKLFLPQLIQSANAAQACFAVIKEHLAKQGGESVSKGKVILATVQGDIHDIGKNIVKVLLDNYGYTVIDLGRDVDPALIVQTAIEQDVRAVGLSALMTTTLGSMEKTTRMLREAPELQNPDGSSKVAVMVGGAVVTRDYADSIGADYYCVDAKATVDACREIFGS